MLKRAEPSISVIGLEYVGLPLAVALAAKFDVVGFDIGPRRIAELRDGHDRTREVDNDRLLASRLAVTSAVEDCRGADIYIVSVPTPVDADKRPDLGAVLTATRMIAHLIDPARRPRLPVENRRSDFRAVTGETEAGGILSRSGFTFSQLTATTG